jgi:hypothetical protein
MGAPQPGGAGSAEAVLPEVKTEVLASSKKKAKKAAAVA